MHQIPYIVVEWRETEVEPLPIVVEWRETYKNDL
jgi:hypothetical protein